MRAHIHRGVEDQPCDCGAGLWHPIHRPGTEAARRLAPVLAALLVFVGLTASAMVSRTVLS